MITNLEEKSTIFESISAKLHKDNTVFETFSRRRGDPCKLSRVAFPEINKDNIMFISNQMV